jgi:hypothetical protein
MKCFTGKLNGRSLLIGGVKSKEHAAKILKVKVEKLKDWESTTWPSDWAKAEVVYVVNANGDYEERID